jgi:hypothetical protein
MFSWSGADRKEDSRKSRRFQKIFQREMEKALKHDFELTAPVTGKK